MIGFRGASPLLRPALSGRLCAGMPGREKSARRDGADQPQADDPVLPHRRRRPQACMAEMAKHGLKRGENGLEIYVMCEIPSNVILAEEFADDLRRLFRSARTT